VAQKLMDMGYKKVYALKGGWREWLKADYPTEKK
jgi:3-mercaptopyruvate sulfurtransferase SseA